MEFFEFFFSGPGWGWKAFALILFTNVIFNGIVGVIKGFYESKSQKILTEIIASMKNTNKSEEDSNATKDDVRS